MAKLNGLAKKYYCELAKTTFGEILAVIETKAPASKKKLKLNVSAKDVARVEKLLAEEGERLWVA